ncbi:hypothetical protein ACE1ET_04585 [Saccharicrinis sp. FJH62]|uniref:hypothetical protein n=1 Tax=Saccharicrinis sp. FJH62 TaxID=3344657 RepID=UPI0035D5155D
MTRFTLVLFLLISVTVSTFAKDVNAWKEEPNLEQQYDVFKKNLNYWNLQYFMTPDQLDQFYGAVKDSISNLEKVIIKSENQILSLQNDLKTNKSRTDQLQAKLDESIKRQNSIPVLGMQVDKSAYSITLYAIIIAVLVFAGIMFLMFKRSNAVTVKTKTEYQELMEEYEQHKKNSLDRYTKINTELHKARMELKQK